MSQIIRQIFSKLNVFVLSRRSAPRFDRRVPITVSLEPEKNGGKQATKKAILSIKGETKDLSASGIAFFIDSIRLHEHYLIGENRVLNAELELPGGDIIKLQLVGVRYEQIGIHDSTAKYMIGARISHIEPPAMEIYKEFLRTGGSSGGGVKNCEVQILELETKEN